MQIYDNYDIEKILIELDKREYLFKRATLLNDEGKLRFLGRGGFASVYEMSGRHNHKEKYALKVIGFEEKELSSEEFLNIIEIQQKLERKEHSNVVEIYEYKELWLNLDEEYNINEVYVPKPEDNEEDNKENQLRFKEKGYIKLQFILMEKLEKLYSGNRRRQNNYSEKEIVDIALNIGYTLKNAHDRKILHRDIKIDNILYSPKTGKYKLGDFGIATQTENGFAGTMKYTSGYAAPEVVRSKDKYDCTADIYSLGIVLFVLANNRKLPDPDQYTKGYTIPRPESEVSDEFFDIIKKACMYDPDMRYQKMDDMLKDLEKLKNKQRITYKKIFINEYYVLSGILFVATCGLVKLFYFSDKVVSYNILTYILLYNGIRKGIKNITKENTDVNDGCIFVLGIAEIILHGFTWWKVLVLSFLFFSNGLVSSVISSGFLLVRIISYLQTISYVELEMLTEYRWLIPLFVIILLSVFEHIGALGSGYKTIDIWINIIFLAAFLLTYRTFNNQEMYKIFVNNIRYVFDIDISGIFKVCIDIGMKKALLGGIIFQLYMYIREEILIKIEKHLPNKTKVCVRCGREYTSRDDADGMYCKACQNTLNDMCKDIKGYMDYAKDILDKKYNEEQIIDIKKHRKEIYDKYVLENAISKKELKNALVNYENLTEEEDAIICEKYNQAVVMSMAGAEISKNFFIPYGYKNTIVDMDDVFAVCYEKSYDFDVMVYAVFTNDPYIPVFAFASMQHPWFLDIKDIDKLHEKICDFLNERCKNLTYEVQSVTEFRDKLYSDSRVYGNIRMDSMLEYIDEMEYQEKIFDEMRMMLNMGITLLDQPLIDAGYILRTEVMYPLIPKVNTKD